MVGTSLDFNAESKLAIQMSGVNTDFKFKKSQQIGALKQEFIKTNGEIPSLDDLAQKKRNSN